MHGKGTYIWQDGRKYEGDYFDDKKNVLPLSLPYSQGVRHLQLARRQEIHRHLARRPVARAREVHPARQNGENRVVGPREEDLLAELRLMKVCY